MKLTGPTIPASHVEFAKLVADAATKCGVNHICLTYRPDFDSGLHRTCGEVTIRFSVTDGRGRPCRNLTIDVAANLTAKIEENPESCS